MTFKRTPWVAKPKKKPLPKPVTDSHLVRRNDEKDPQSLGYIVRKGGAPVNTKKHVRKPKGKTAKVFSPKQITPRQATVALRNAERIKAKSQIFAL